MQKISTTADLKSAIQQLEAEQAIAWPVLKDRFLTAADTLKPASIVRNTFKKLIAAPDLKTNAIKAFFGLAAGLVTTKLLMGKMPHPVLKLLAGTIMGMASATGTSKAVTGIKSAGGVLLKKIFSAQSPEAHNGNRL